MELDYFNARLKGLKGRLLKARDYESLLSEPGPGEFLELLKTTPYGPYIGIAEARFTGVGEVTDEALKLSLTDTLAFLYKTAPPVAGPLIKAFLSLWESYNLKAVIRGIVKGIKRDEVRSVLIPAGEFNAAALNELLGSKDVADLIRLLDTWGSGYAVPLKRGYEAFLKVNNVIELELELDHFVFAFPVTGLKKRSHDHRIIRDVFQFNIDVRNIMTLIKIAGEGYRPEAVSAFFIPGGRLIKKELFMELATLKTRDELVNAVAGNIKDARFALLLSGADYENMGVVEESLNDLLVRRLLRLSVTDPLSIALAAYVILMKVREIKNVRMIARAAAFAIPEVQVRRFLFYSH
ncbi:MAG: V-type ATP synthase subunit C [Thermodesulfobacteriota bacterium]|nr:MAG: V-type ATP synthase subunit C [Thermodesulfobacteriota bacterium]